MTDPLLQNLLKSSLYELLLKSKSEKKFFLESKDKQTTVLALGPTEQIAFSDAPIFLKTNSQLLLWSAMTFENTESSVLYASYLTLIQKDGITSVIFNPRISCSVEELFQDKELEDTHRKATIQLFPNFNEWQDMLENALDLVQTNKLLKVVLKRKKIVNFEKKICPLEIFKEIYSQDSETYQIFVQQNNEQAFISFTPEKLFSLTDNSTIETLSLAGSVPRGISSEEDQAFENQLLNSDKLTNEQKIVTDEICHRLTTLANLITLSPLSIMKLNYIQHRANTITATLNAEKNFLDLITTLHPTPAVGGAPSAFALETIALLEKDHRNNYSAPIGFATSKYSEWAVGLRSAAIDSNKLTVFAGCGIVAGSDPQSEWDETENKMRPFLNILEKDNFYV